MNKLMVMTKKISLSCTVSLVAMSVFAASATASAEDTKSLLEAQRNFSLVEQPLNQALANFSVQTNLLIVAPSNLVNGISAPAVSGTMSPSEALEKLLKGTGLGFSRGENGQVHIQQSYNMSAQSTQVGGDASTEKEEVSFILEEIIVTAEKRAESLQDIPIAISAYSSETIETRNIWGIADLKQLSPSLQYGRGDNNPYVSIRGIGAELPNLGAESGVAIAQDGVVFSTRFMFDASFMDVERVEVLRGPQGTISGRNATGGAINIHSKKPTDDFEGRVKFTLGSYNRFATESYVSGPIIEDKLLARIAMRTDQADGWLRNVFLGQDQNTINEVQIRASLLARPSENLEAYLILESAMDRGIKAAAVDGGRLRADTQSIPELFDVPGGDFKNLEFYADTPTSSDNYKKRQQAILKLTWDMGPSSTLVSTTGYVDLSASIAGDYDGTSIPVSEIPVVPIDAWQFSQELTYTTDLTDKLDLILGGLYYRSYAAMPLTIGLPQIGLPVGTLQLDPEQNLTSYAAYTQLRYQLTDTVRLSLGTRYTIDDKDYYEEKTIFGGVSEVEGKDSWRGFTPRFSVNYEPNDDVSLYASVAKGFKSGGFNTYAGALDQFEPETVWNYEVGAKTSWFDRRVKANVTAFYMDYTNLQQNLFLTLAEGGTQVFNAGSATIKGLEIETEALVTEQFLLTASATWLDAKYQELTTNDNLFPELGERDLSGNRLTRTPKFQFNVAGDYTVPVSDSLQVVLHVDYAWQGHIFFTFFNHDLVSQDAYGLLNLSASLETVDGTWELMAFARNLTDERYFTSKLTSVGSGPVPWASASLGDPRMYGLSLAYRF